ncbi:MAG: hypothetical protein R3D44_00415 [Hyphomicrobiaceae bacterium]
MATSVGSLTRAPPRQAPVPTLCILIAPPAVGFLSWVALTGSVEGTARVLFYFALLMTLFLTTRIPRLARMPFYLSWWAYSFPLAAMTVASWAMYERPRYEPLPAIAALLLAAVTLVVAGLALRTVGAIAQRQICRPE